LALKLHAAGIMSGSEVLPTRRPRRAERSGRQRAGRPTVCLLAALLAFGVRPLRADDPKEILRRAIVLDSEESKLRKQYTYIERDEERKLDRAGKVASRESKTWDVTQLDGRQFRSLIQQNDKPLTPKELQQEEERKQKIAAQRRKNAARRAKETPEQRDERQAKAHRQDEEDARQIIDAFDLRLLPDEQIDGMPVWVVEGTPRKGYQFKNGDLRFFGKLQGRIWISKSDYQPVKIEAESIDTIAFGGIVARVQKGARLHVEFTRVNSEVWLPKHFSVTFNARLLVVKGFHQEEDITYSNYKKFSAESRIVDDQQ
jgi:hypothetical protein